MVEVKRSNPKAFEVLNARLKELEGKVAKVGFFPKDAYEDGTPVAYVATIQELGSPRNSIPPRPFMRPTANEKKDSWKGLAASGARAVLAGNATAADVMESIGLRAAGDIAQTISQISAPPLSPITIQLRAWRREGRVITGKTVGEAARLVHEPDYVAPSVSVKPLVDSARLINAVSSVVEDDDQ